jgi:roadblock/LC7 domain-containing protein
MKKIIDSALDGNLKVQEETLSDGSRGYSVFVGKYEIPAEDYAWAGGAFAVMLMAIQKLEQRNRGEI